MNEHFLDGYGHSQTYRTVHADWYGEVVFKRTDGHTVTFDNVLVDSIGPAGMPTGVIGFETATDEVVSLPFVESWTVNYRF